jgi:hypothetical protein
MCPYLRVGEFQTTCVAYMGPYTEPSVYEQEYYCASCSHSDCVWFLSQGREVTQENNASLIPAPAGAERIADVLAHSTI